MRINRGRGWEDMGPTNTPETVPGNQLPFRSMGRQEFTGNLFRQRESLACVIAPEVKGEFDKSRHVGIMHVLNAHTHAAGLRYQGANIPADVYVTDPHVRYGVRRTAILKVTHPHDCMKHLPLGDDGEEDE